MGLCSCVCACVFYRESVEERKREGARSDGYIDIFWMKLCKLFLCVCMCKRVCGKEKERERARARR